MGFYLNFCSVIVKSYSGALTSSLAIKHLPTPFKTLDDVFQHPTMNVGFERGTIFHQFVMVRKSFMDDIH